MGVCAWGVLAASCRSDWLRVDLATAVDNRLANLLESGSLVLGWAAQCAGLGGPGPRGTTHPSSIMALAQSAGDERADENDARAKAMEATGSSSKPGSISRLQGPPQANHWAWGGFEGDGACACY